MNFYICFLRQFKYGELNGVGVNNNLYLGVFSKVEINGLGVICMIGDVLLVQFIHGKCCGNGQHSSMTKIISGVLLNGELVEETGVFSTVEKSMEVLRKS
eukprot:snap_masked-scaffold_3-processed-gene-17.16-mRNA-1 protein AED:1.00 eAED:1.00 QI:0/0/0/0/1/1/3/0/99